MMEQITPELMITVVTASLTAITLFMVLIALGSLFRIKKRLRGLEETSLERDVKQGKLQENYHMMVSGLTKLDEANDKIFAMETRLQETESQCTETHNYISKLDAMERQLTAIHSQLIEQMSKLNEYDKLLAQAGQSMGKDGSAFMQAVQRIGAIEEEFHGLKAFQHTFELIRRRLLDAFDEASTGMWLDDPQATPPNRFKQRDPVPPNGGRSD